MTIASALARRRGLSLVAGLMIAGLAAAHPASPRVVPAPDFVASNTVDSTPPTTTVSGGQSNPRSATFVLGASEATSGFECDLDGGGFSSCSSPFTVDHLAFGAHSISVRATDAAGNVDPSPAVEAFTIASAAPVQVRDAWGPVVYAPQSLAVTSAGTTTLSFAWSAVGRAGDAVSYRVSRNGVLVETDTDLQATMTGLGCGRTYTISVAAQDASGHVSAPNSIMASTVQCRTPAVPVTLSVPQAVGPGDTLSATATGAIRSVSFGYCPGTTCTWATSIPIGSISGPGQADVWWSSPPPDGTYTVVARAEDTSGATGDTNPAIVTVDSTTPDTAIATGPNGFSPATAAFNFDSSETAARFECDLDGSGFFPCLQTFSPSGLALGSHTLAVRAVDLAGNVDPTPVTRAWTLDVDPPDTTLLAGQAATTPVPTATFTLGSNEPGTFECKLDNAGVFTPCDSDLSFTGFSAGLHKLTARAVDRAGNVDPTPVVANWTATSPTTPPDTTITSAPAALVNTRGVLVFFTSTNPFAAFQCSVDGGSFVPCLDPRPINNLADGPHTFQVRATIGGLTDPTPATASFTVDATAPTVTLTPSRPADGAGWYRNAVSFATTGIDAGGAVTCTAPQSYDGPDVSHLSIVGTCTDTAGNSKSKTFDLRYDTTAPSVRVAFRVRDRNGWYNRPFNVTWLGTDAGSGGVTCTPVQHYAGPDVASGMLTGSCADAAGNSASADFPFAYDDTDPSVAATASRPPDVDTWYNAPVSVSFDGTDAMSGGVTCDAPVDYAGPDSGTASVSGTCSDAAGNAVPATLALAYDATPPTVTASASRAPDHNGWYNAPVAVSFSGTDGTSGGVSCDSSRLYSGPDGAHISLLGTCSDAAGNYAAGSIDVAYDATGPSVAVAAARPADHNGWYNAAVSFSTTGSDAVSGLASCTLPVQYFTPDTATGKSNGSCTDVAGNTTSSSTAFKYDATAPTATASPSSAANAAGWHNAPFSVGFAGSDATSGPVTCSPSASYPGPDTASASLSGSCTDQAGNVSASASYSFAYDATAPSVTALASRPADKNGWYNHPVSVSFSGADTLSNGVVCSAAQSVASDAASALVAGTCTDAAGNTGTGTLGLSYDATAPTVTATAARAANANGWYRTAIGVSFAGTDALSGIGPCDAATTYSGPDTAATTVSGSCSDLAGNPASGSLVVHYDATAPSVTAALDRAADSGTWFNHAVSASFSGTDATSGGVTCDGPKSYSTPDSATASLSGSCTDAAGNTGSASKSFAYDSTPPAVTVSANRPPDANGRYRSAVTFTTSGTDATSGGVACDPNQAYAGPDAPSALISGSCTDAAGNKGTGSTTIAYDATPPDTALLATPAALTNATTSQFAFASTEDGTFTCTLDGVSSACSNPTTVSGLGDGAHTFSVAGVDLAGNTDPVPASYSWTVDTIAPDTTLDSTGVVDPNSGPASFPLSSEAGATFQCSLDAAPFAACSSPASFTVAQLSNGQHTLQARAVDAAGNVDPTPASYSWTEDNSAPTVTLTGTPTSPSSSTSATFNWTTDEPAAFTCRVDLATFASCGTGTSTSGTKTFNGLAQGTHTFVLRSRDGAGNLTTTSFTWSIDTGPPNTILDTSVGNVPANPTASTTASFSFTADETSTFKCQLDNGGFTACTSPKTYSALADGNHTFAVEAIDAAGNIDPTPATFSWLVDITNPSGAISTPTEAATVSGATPVTATATDNVSVLNVQFKLDGADLGSPVTSAPYTVNWDTTVTADGAHTLTAVIKDEVANTTTTTAVHVTVNNSAHPIATQSPDLVDVGPGNVDATTRNVIRTAAGRVYIVANDDHGLSSTTRSTNGGAGVIHVYKGNQLGTPTAFSEVDVANHPISGGRSTATTAFGGVDARLGSDGIIRMIYNDNASSLDLIFRTFSTVTDTWGAAEDVDAPVGTQERGRIKYALALDASNVPHVVWVKGTTLLYSNRATGTWSAPVTIATGSPLHPMLAFDTTGVLHVAWLEEPGTGSSLRYASRTGTTWSTPELIPTGAILSNSNADQGPSIATDSAGHPYVLYVGQSLGTFGPTGRTALYGAIKAMEKINGAWTDVSPPSSTAPAQYLTHTPQVFLKGNDLYAFNGHDTAINFAYGQRLAGGSWSSETKLTNIVADGSASIRWDPLHETDASIIDATTYNEDRLGDHSFLPEVYYMAVKPSVADSTPPTVSLTAPAAGTVAGTVAVSANASDNIGVAGVTFKVDGSSIAPEDTTSPYSVSWDTTTATNGTHVITAVARDGVGNTTTSTSVTVTTSNAAPIPAPAGTLLFGSLTALTSTDTNLPGQIEAFDVGTVTGGALGRMHVFLDTPLPPSLLVGLYSNNAAAGTPATLLATTAIPAPVAGWNDVAFGPISLTLATKYWVAILTPNGAANGPHFRDTKAGIGAGIFLGSGGFTTLPSPWPAGGTKNTDGPMSAYGSTS
jgi:large repetitive protein